MKIVVFVVCTECWRVFTRTVDSPGTYSVRCPVGHRNNITVKRKGW